jgi:hypothetical protein
LGGIVGEGTAEAGAEALREPAIMTSVRTAAVAVMVAGKVIMLTATMTGPVDLEAAALAGEVAVAEAPVVEVEETEALSGKGVPKEGLKSSSGTGKKNKEMQATKATQIIIIMTVIIVLMMVL